MQAKIVWQEHKKAFQAVHEFMGRYVADCILFGAAATPLVPPGRSHCNCFRFWTWTLVIGWLLRLWVAATYHVLPISGYG